MMMNGETQMEMVSNMANALILLSKSNYNNGGTKRFFKCKTCNKEFSSFQALGGHRASHKKPAALDGSAAAVSAAKLKTKTHECSICGAAFAIGQALGGHMRRHRSIIHMSGGIGATAAEKAVGIFPGPVMMKKSSGNGNSKRVLCLDLNLTPLENDDLKLELGRMAT